MTDTEIINWIEEITKYGVTIKRQDDGTWSVDFGLHGYEAQTLREVIEYAKSNEHIQPIA